MAAVPPATLIEDGLRLVSSVLIVVGRVPSCGTRRSGPPEAAATGPAARASGKLAPDASVTTEPGDCGWKADCEMATAVAYRSAPARRVWGKAAGTLIRAAAPSRISGSLA